MKTETNIIVAYANNNIIGIHNELPWSKQNGDLSHFKKSTTGCPIIMGYSTWASLKRPYLPDRCNIVLTSRAQQLNVEREKKLNELVMRGQRADKDIMHGPHFVSSIKQATIVAQSYLMDKTNKIIWVIGGESVYKQYLDLNLIDKIVCTQIKVQIKQTYD